MAIQALSMPVNIPWQRLAYSADMVDTDFRNGALPPKWRSSLTVFSYVVPSDQTASSYPDARIIYLRICCSLTGFNPNEELRKAVPLDTVSDRLDDLQRSTWEAVFGSEWAASYYPCLGAIAQIAVYPSIADFEISIDDYPYVMDFEPKKRELYETRTDSGEVLSGSSRNLKVQKGTNSAFSAELTNITSTMQYQPGPSVETPLVPGTLPQGPVTFPVTTGFSVKTDSDFQSVETYSSDLSRERRETQSHTTVINQLYQLFNGYHVGSNRALFVILPRPHVVSGLQQTEFNLIDGIRRLEGLQDMFLVVYAPSKLKGICIQANLDTGHTLADPGSASSLQSLILSRRTIRNCGAFTETGALISTGTELPKVATQISFEKQIHGFDYLGTLGDLKTAKKGTERAQLADQLNLFLRQTVARSMLDGFSAGSYQPRSLVETDTFKRLLQASLQKVDLPLNSTSIARHVDARDVRKLTRAGFYSVSDLFRREADGSDKLTQSELVAVRTRLVGKVLEAVQARS
jgi:hypothetical protein